MTEQTDQQQDRERWLPEWLIVEMERSQGLWRRRVFDEIDSLCRQLSEQEEVRGKLPRTADGVPVVPGMKLYPLHPIPDAEDDHGIATIGIYDPATMEHHVHGYDEFRTGLCYSTKEAAEAALAAKGGDDEQ